MAWFRNVVGKMARKFVPNVLTSFELKLPGKYKDTFIEKWGEYI
jgi:hypothetical protein